MPIANCTRCHKVFNKLYERKICPDCIQEDEDAYARVVTFLDDHPGSPLPEIAAGAEVEENQILRFIREGRLTLLDKLGEDARVACKRCNEPISSGQYCQPCYEKVQAELQAARHLAEGPKIKPQEKRGWDSSRWHDRR